ncbi:hypothetical protein, partial [Pseudomonas corrugata]|uniref:hypothetical protein n=1 Tax=Pseudomonas corrugata TaxID=47879 RepID=UPI001F520307
LWTEPSGQQDGWLNRATNGWASRSQELHCRKISVGRGVRKVNMVTAIEDSGNSSLLMTEA